MKTAAIFDLDGTILDSMGVWCEADAKFLGKYGYVPDTAYMEKIVTLPFTDGAQYILERYGLPLTVQQVKEELFHLAYDAYAYHVPLKDGVREYLQRLQDKKVPMAVATSGVKQMCEAAMKRLGLEQYFDAVVYTEEIGKNKEFPDVFYRAAKEMKCAPDCCLVFEDSPHAVLGAHQAGMGVIGIYDDFSKGSEQFMRKNCLRYIRSYYELMEQDVF